MRKIAQPIKKNKENKNQQEHPNKPYQMEKNKEIMQKM